MASRNVDLVINGIKNLTLSEKQELAKLLSVPGDYLTESQNTRYVSLEKSFLNVNSISTSPVGHGSCACCGR